jgi:hypothetical protein
MYNNIENINNNNPHIFTKKIIINNKLIPFNKNINDVAKTKYLPPVAKEWKNNVYNYNSKNIVNYPIYDLKINSLIKGYFNLYFNNKFLNHRFISRKKRIKSLNKILVSKAEIKHTNAKAIITIYVYNREKIILKKKIQELKKSIKKYIIKIFPKLLFFNLNVSDILFDRKNILENENIFKYNTQFKAKKKKIIKIFNTLRKYKLRLSLNKYKFEDKFLFKLSNYITKYYGKKVEFNIVDIKNITRNGDIFTQILTSKIKEGKGNPLSQMNRLLGLVKINSEVNTIKERGRLPKSVDLEYLENKYSSNNLISIFNQENLINTNVDNLDKLLINLHSKLERFVKKSNVDEMSYLKILNIVLDNIKYKKVGGVKLIVKGRLTKRYRADRAVFKLKWKGGLKNIDSAFKGMSGVVFRGYLDPNVEKSRCVSKRRIGSFGVTGWLSGK